MARRLACRHGVHRTGGLTMARAALTDPAGGAGPDDDGGEDQDLTWRQREILGFYQDYLGRNGYAPSMREVAAGVGLSSVSSVAYQLRQLEKLGRISLDARRSRAAVLRVSQLGEPGGIP